MSKRMFFTTLPIIAALLTSSAIGGSTASSPNGCNAIPVNRGVEDPPSLVCQITDEAIPFGMRDMDARTLEADSSVTFDPAIPLLWVLRFLGSLPTLVLAPSNT
jgi:hypothetical protein